MTTVAQGESPSASGAPPKTHPRRGPRRRALSHHLYVVPAAVFVLLTVIYPLLYNITQSFFDVGLREVAQGGATWVGLSNYADQFGRTDFWHAFQVSLVYSFGTVALTFAIGLGMALLFRRPFRGRAVTRALILLVWVLPTVVGASVWRWLLDGSYGLLNAVLRGAHLINGDVFWLGEPNTAVVAVIVATAWSIAPLAMILLAAGLQGIPQNLYEAARIDGASSWQQFSSLTFPLLRPVSLTTALLIFIFTFKSFDTIFLMTGGGPGGATEILPVYAYKEAFEFSRFDTAAVATTMLMVVPVVMSVLYFRALRSEEAA